MQQKEWIKQKKLKGSHLKWIAIVTMLIDHIGAFLLNPALASGLIDSQFSRLNMALRLIGRVSFPIFAFLLVEGFAHTSSIKRYLMQLATFALVAEVPFNLAKESVIFDSTYQNIFLTLLIGLLVISLFDRLKEVKHLKWLVLVIGMLVAEALRTDYSAYGILLIFVFYYFRTDMELRNPIAAFLLLMQATAVFALIPIQLYNGERGNQNKFFSICFIRFIC